MGGREEEQRDLDWYLCEIIRCWSYLLTFLLARRSYFSSHLGGDLYLVFTL